ncbi:DnaB-like helicase N-terminal domain-containing protein [Streptomyces ochraceiscleroticus]|uniref:DnaB-like helicase N-terminal domain-containing protein n=1 Tax=Streptomyces ochraceiscleroticus TaxID=47761 RepID=A0ABW1MUI9_9ACTN|nr:DnaB-like helicase N-terminal domain-containing protein [Streptomyces ochraceiscleroticus]
MTPLFQAEQAVLGAALLEPRQLGPLSDWLRPEHFYRPAHAALYAAMLDLHSEQHPVTTAPPDVPVPLDWVNDTLARASAHTRGLTASHLHALASACPRPAHAPLYGRMVLEGAIHRSVAEHAARLYHAARTDADRGADVAETLRQADVLRDVLNDLGRRWGTEPRVTQPAAPQTASAAPTDMVDQRLMADEEFLLGTLTTSPQQLGEVADWLRPEDFADPGHRQIYRALAALRHRGEPIDQLTLLWECQRRGALADGTLDADRVRRLCDTAAGGSADYFGEQVLNAALLRTAATSAHHIRNLAKDPSLAPTRLIGHAVHHLEPLESIRRRRETSHAEPAPNTPQQAEEAAPPPARAIAARTRSRPRFPATSAPAAPTPPAPAEPRRPHTRRSHS